MFHFLVNFIFTYVYITQCRRNAARLILNYSVNSMLTLHTIDLKKINNLILLSYQIDLPYLDRSVLRLLLSYLDLFLGMTKGS